MQSDFQEGWNEVLEHSSNYTGSLLGDNCGRISEAIQDLEETLNKVQGKNTPSGQLSGNMAEFWHAGTFNINAAMQNSVNQTTVEESNGLASVDISSSWGEDFGLKYMRDAAASAKEQSISWFQKYKEFTFETGKDISFEDYCTIKKIPDTAVLNDPIYQGQVRIIPADQYNDAIEWLKNKIAKEELTRPEQVKRYKDTLELLQKVIKSPDGVESIELTKEQAIKLADLGKQGKVEAYDTHFCTELEWQTIVGRSLKAGATAAIITFVMKMAPEIIKIVSKMIKEGEVDADELKELGWKALPATGESFIRGFIASSLTLAYENGKFGNMLHIKPEMVPSVIGVLTVITISTIKDSILLSKGKISQQEFLVNLNRTLFVSGCAYGLGVLAQAVIPIPFAYFIGNFVGTLIGSFSFKYIDNVFVAICVEKGYTFFNLVRQDYTLPDEVLKELGIDWANVDEIYLDETIVDDVDIDEISIDECEGDYIKVLHRGVFKVHHVGYLYT